MIHLCSHKIRCDFKQMKKTSKTVGIAEYSNWEDSIILKMQTQEQKGKGLLLSERKVVSSMTLFFPQIYVFK